MIIVLIAKRKLRGLSHDKGSKTHCPGDGGHGSRFLLERECFIDGE